MADIGLDLADSPRSLAGQFLPPSLAREPAMSEDYDPWVTETENQIGPEVEAIGEPEASENVQDESGDIDSSAMSLSEEKRRTLSNGELEGIVSGLTGFRQAFPDDDYTDEINLSYADNGNAEEEEQFEQFDWDHCLPDQMFVFSAEDINKILDLAITRIYPQRSASQKLVAANVLFLSARFAHYYSTPELLKELLAPALKRIEEIIESHDDDMAFLAFWLSNLTLLLYYMHKDTSLSLATAPYQQELTESINTTYMLFVRDTERRLDEFIDPAILDHEPIPLDDIQFTREWSIFRRHTPTVDQIRPPSPDTLARPAPRRITSLLSSTLFVLELYDIHPDIILQVFAQIFYWLNATIFNRIMANRKYLARTKAMQLRLNVSAIEDWARIYNRRSSASMNTTMAELCRLHLSPLVQLLQWLQCFSSLGDDSDIAATLQQLPNLTPKQLLHVVKRYRTEVGEEKISKTGLRYLTQAVDSHASESSSDVFIDISLTLPFNLPTDMRRHIPVLPPEFMAKLDATSSLSTGVPSINGRARDDSVTSRYTNAVPEDLSVREDELDGVLAPSSMSPIERKLVTETETAMLEDDDESGQWYQSRATNEGVIEHG